MASTLRWILRIRGKEPIDSPVFEIWNDPTTFRSKLTVNDGYILEIIDAKTRNLITVPRDFVIENDDGLWIGVFVQQNLSSDAFQAEFV